MAEPGQGEVPPKNLPIARYNIGKDRNRVLPYKLDVKEPKPPQVGSIFTQTGRYNEPGKTPAAKPVEPQEPPKK